MLKGNNTRPQSKRGVPFLFVILFSPCALFAVSPDYRVIGRPASQIAQKLFSAPATASLGIQRPEKFRLAINTKTAKRLGINVSRIQERSDVVWYP